MSGSTIAVCTKITVDTAQLRADPETGEPRWEGVPSRISTFDENALEAAVRLKEQHGDRVVALSLASAEPPRELLLKALAMGADELRLVLDPTADRADALATATLLAAALRKLGAWRLVVCGDGSIDQYSRQVGPRVAQQLGIASLTHVTRIELERDRVEVQRSLEDRRETVEAPLPALVTVGQETNEPRLPAVLQIMGASSKPVVTWRPEDLGLPAGSSAAAMAGLLTRGVAAPPTNRKHRTLDGESAAETAATLVRELSRDGGVGVR